MTGLVNNLGGPKWFCDVAELSPFGYNIRESCRLRLTGLVAQGSIPWTIVGLIALFLIAFARSASNKLSGLTSSKEVPYMRQQKQHLKLVGFPILDTLWAIGVGIAAGALPA